MKIVVGMADMRVAHAPDDLLITYALGSCLGIAIYDPVARVGGLLHVMLPTSTLDEDKAKQNPYMFVDTGVHKLFRECYALGGLKERLTVSVAGGACTSTTGNDHFQIGQRNFTMLRRLLWKNGVLLGHHDVGGNQPRTMQLDMDSGQVVLKTGNLATVL